MATLVKFEQFVTDVADGVHAASLTADTDVWKIYLTNDAPSVSLDLIKTDLAEITNENGYAAPVDAQNSATETTGTITVVCVDVVITASGGTVGPFRYAVLYNDTPAGPVDPLICYWDHGSNVTLQNGESFTVDFGADVIQIA